MGARLSALIDGELRDAQRERVLSHLARCEECRREATALRLLKRRMHTLNDAAASDALTWRLLALAPGGPTGVGRLAAAGRRRAVRVLVAAGLAVAGVGLSAAAFLAGGTRPSPGPRVVPALDVFMAQHAITTGGSPVRPEVPAGPIAVPGQP
jgi:anti-sigma factor RsiW